MKAFFLSSGFGKRFLPYTNKIAKPALPFLGLPLLAFPLFYALKLIEKEFIFNLHHKGETIQSALHFLQKKSLLLSKKIFHFSIEEPLILGTGGGIKQARKFLSFSETTSSTSTSPTTFSSKENILLINADSLFFLFQEDTLKCMLDQHIKNKALSTLLVTPFSNCKGINNKNQRRGIRFLEKTKDIISFRDDSTLNPNEKRKTCFLHYTGAQILSKEIFDLIPSHPSHIFKDVLSPAIKKGYRVQAFIENHLLWFETGNINSYSEALNTSLRALKLKKNETKKEEKQQIKESLEQKTMKDKEEFLLKESLFSILRSYSLNDNSQDILRDHLNFNLDQQMKRVPWLKEQK